MVRTHFLTSAAISALTACCCIASCAPQSHEPAAADHKYERLATLPPVSLTATTGSAPLAEQPSLAAARRYARARWLLLKRNPTVAVKELNAARRLDADSPQILKLLGKALWSASRRQKAAEAYRQAIRIGGEDIESNYQLGWFHYLRNEFEQARRHFKAVNNAKPLNTALPQYVMCQFYIARCEDRLGNTEAAIRKYKRFMALTASYRSSFRALPELLWLMRKPSLIPIYIARAQTALLKHDEAAATLIEANGKHPTWVLGHVELARIYLLTGKGPKALQVSRGIAERSHGSNEALKLAAEVYKALGKSEQLLTFLAALSRRHPDQVRLLEFRADALKNAGKTEEARGIYQQILALRADSPTALLELAKLQHQKGELKVAILTLIRGLDHSRPDGGLAAVFLRRFIRQATAKQRAAASKELLDAPTSTARIHLALGLLASTDGKLKIAVEHMRACLPAMADVAFVHATLGRTLDRAGRPVEALSVYRKAAAAELSVPYFHRAAGDLHMAAGRNVEARDAYREALNLAPDHMDARLGLAMAYAKLGQFLSAESEMRRVLKTQPASTVARLALGEILLSGLRDATRAAREARRVLVAEPKNAAALQLLARTRIHLKDYQQALLILKPLAARNAEDWKTRLLLAAVYLTRQEKGDLQLASEQLEAVLVNRPNLLEALSMLIDVRLGLKEYPRASQLLEQILKIAPKDDASRRTLAAVRISLGQPGKAVDLLRQLVTENPANIAYMEDLALALAHNGKRDESEAVLHRVLKINPNHAAANNNLGYAWADRGIRLDDAERMIRTAVAKEPGSVAYRDSLAWVLYKKGKLKDASKQLDAIIKDPQAKTDPVIWDHHGDALWRLGKREDALAAWRASLRENKQPNDEMKKIARQTRQKIEAAGSGKSVEVAPLGDGYKP